MTDRDPRPRPMVVEMPPFRSRKPPRRAPVQVVRAAELMPGPRHAPDDLLPEQPPARDILRMTREELLLYKTDVDSDVRKITEQIKAAHARVYERGEYSDRDWYVRANKALHHRKRLSQQMQVRLGQLRDEAKRANVAASTKIEDAELFIKVARRLLDEEQFARIWREVDVMRAALEKGP